VAIAREDPLRAGQIDHFLAERDWLDVASFCAYVCQMRSLHLRPWESPPSSADSDEDSPEGELLRRMLVHGLSRYEPDPIVALAERERATPVG
jgi:hypothetical protein